MNFHHIPVMLGQCVDNLSIKPDGTYLDGTLGGGGHSSAILSRLGDKGALYGIDRDAEAIEAATERIKDSRFTAVSGNFHDIKEIALKLGVSGFDGALLDLGVSSRQLDEASRGFSYQFDAALDMRMDKGQELTAAVILNDWPAEDISRILWDYGEERWHKRISEFIAERRKNEPFATTKDLVDVIDAAIPKKVRSRDGSHPARRSFQALRIAVNDELKPLDKAIRDITQLLNPGGRLCVMAFHSLEDRIVKLAMRDMADPCTCPKDIPVCVCGKKPLVKVITRKPITADEDELAINPRARSAVLRVCERLNA